MQGLYFRKQNSRWCFRPTFPPLSRNIYSARRRSQTGTKLHNCYFCLPNPCCITLHREARFLPFSALFHPKQSGYPADIAKRKALLSPTVCSSIPLSCQGKPTRAQHQVGYLLRVKWYVQQMISHLTRWHEDLDDFFIFLLLDFRITTPVQVGDGLSQKRYRFESRAL